jgi:PGF-CTERM protein
MALVVAAVVAPLAAGQTAIASPRLAEDGSADVAFDANGVPAALPGGRMGPVDLVGLALEESASDITVRLTVADLEPDGEAPFLESAQYEVGLRHNDRTYRVVVFRSMLTEVQYGGFLAAGQTGQPFTSVIADLVVTADPATATIVAVVPRDLLIDSQGSAPFPGRTLEGFWVYSTAIVDTSGIVIGGSPAGGAEFPTVRVYDRMPDQGNGSLGWPIQIGLRQTGAMHLSSLTPIRASNGEATTFLFEVDATNRGPTQRFVLEASGVPAGWLVQLPSESIEVAEGQSARLPILVTTPFAHQHGNLQTFVVEATGASQPDDVGRIRLGVRYTSPAQPAGHHPTLYIHTSPYNGDPTLPTAFSTAFGLEWRSLYANTLADDPLDAGVPVGGVFETLDLDGGVPRLTYSWFVPLGPPLEMGLDFDLAATGSIAAAFDTVLPLPGAVFEGRVIQSVPDGRTQQDCTQGGCTSEDFYLLFGTHTTVATFAPTAAKDVLPATTGASFATTVQATPAGDYLPFTKGAQLGLQLNLTFTRADPFLGPHDLPKLAGGETTLPLLEYHDPVDQSFSGMAGLMLHVEGEPERLVNPGRTVVFDLALSNHGQEAGTYHLTVTGTNAEWASLIGDIHLTLAAGESRAVALAVAVPASATDAQVADLVVTASDPQDPTARTLARLVAVVDTDADHPDEAGRVPGLAAELTKKDSPGLAPSVALAALAAAALVLRRRR